MGLKIALATLLGIIPLHARASPLFPSVCDLMNSSTFEASMEFVDSPAVCPGLIPRPCVQFTYYVPKYFIEVVENEKETFFGYIPGAKLQLETLLPKKAYGGEDDEGSYAYQAHVINIPFAQEIFGYLPCGGEPKHALCFSMMSEHLGTNWRTGLGDIYQPYYLAWALQPEMCIAKGAAQSLMGGGATAVKGDSGTCSFNQEWLPYYPPSKQSVCTGWGFHFPRSGVVTSSDPTTASLVVASRIRSLGAELPLNGPSISSDEKWQMVIPQISSCFREGENISTFIAKRVGEEERLKGQARNYLYAIWQRTSCVRDLPYLPAVKAMIYASKAICKIWR